MPRSEIPPTAVATRLQKFLAETGEYSRRNAEVVIREGKVRVNGKTVMDPAFRVDPEHDRIDVRGKIVRLPHKGILLLNKPRGVISTLSDPQGRPTVADFLTKHHRSYFPVGRLDWDSSGIMVLTNDGDIAERLMHPRFGFSRVYQVRVEGEVKPSIVERIRKGVTLADGSARGEASIMKADEKSSWLEIIVREGRNRLVRRMFEKLGFPVMKLKRIAYGPFKVGNMQPGDVRKLSEREYERVRALIMRTEAKSPEETEKAAAHERKFAKVKPKKRPGVTKNTARRRRD